MKSLSFLIPLILLSGIFCNGQGVQPASPGKAVVYFVRPSMLGFAINFSYYDSTNLVDKFNGAGYLRYECEPGFHLFWGKAENKDFIEADLEAGKIYLVEAAPQLGAITYGVRLIPVDPNDEKRVARLIKFMNKKTPVSIVDQVAPGDQQESSAVVKRAMEKYLKDKESGQPVSRLEKEMNYEIK
jgi:hypothetical protein